MHLKLSRKLKIDMSDSRIKNIDEYTAKYLTSHLFASHQDDRLYEILVTQSVLWKEIQAKKIKGYSLFLDDLERLKEYFDFPITHQKTLKLLCTVAVIITTRFRVLAYDDNALRALVSLKRAEEALEAVNSRANIEGQCQGLIAIYDALLESHPLSPVLHTVTLRILELVTRDQIHAKDDSRILQESLSRVINKLQYRKAILALNSIKDDWCKLLANVDIAKELLRIGDQNYSKHLEAALHLTEHLEFSQLSS